jgi:F-type H+-transporting ATPase subunit delta
LLAVVASDALMQDMISNPAIESSKIVDVMAGVAGDNLNDTGKNFLNVLAENGRLNVLPEIAELYEQHRAEAEKTVEAEITSAFPLSDAQKQQLIDALKNRLGREISLVTKTDESIIGGAIVRAGDLVIDGSVSSQLDKLGNSLMR